MDSESVTATKAQVLDGYTAVTKDSNDEAAEGTLPNRGAVSHSLAINGSYTIPQGYHNGSGKVSQSIPTQGAKTITPGASQQQVAAGRYLTGAITVPGFSMPAANLIKKGAKITIYGRSVTGTWEGYVASNKDIYNRGAWGSGYSLSSLKATYWEDAAKRIPNISQDGSSIILSVTNQYWCGGFIINKAINLSAYKTANVVFNADHESSSSEVRLFVTATVPSEFSIYEDYFGYKDSGSIGINEKTVSLDISNINQNAYIVLMTVPSTIVWHDNLYIKRIYFT